MMNGKDNYIFSIDITISNFEKKHQFNIYVFKVGSQLLLDYDACCYGIENCVGHILFTDYKNTTLTVKEKNDQIQEIVFRELRNFILNEN